MFRKLRIFFRIAVLLSILFMLDSCYGCQERRLLKNRHQAGPLPVLDTGVFYRADIKEEPFIVCFTSSTEQAAEGYYYRQADAPFAEPHPFLINYTDEVDFMDVDLIPYREPVFKLVDTSRYRIPFCEVEVTNDVVYGRSEGYWTSLPGVEEDVLKVFTEGIANSFKKNDLDLTMDIYVPRGVMGKKPLVLFLHGGAFYIGDKAEPAYKDFCYHFASMGYVAVSMNYRMGFHANKSEVERAGYAATQDAHAAMRYLVAHADEYGINPELLFVAGSSAGSITALNLAFMREENRPQSSHGTGGLIRKDDMGPLDSSGNDIRAGFSIKAVGNMWGAVNNLDMLGNSRTDIISFHGDADNVVPYDQGYPFQTAGKVISKALSDTMFGSASIDRKAKALGLRSVMNTFHGLGHALNTDKKTKVPNANHFTIRTDMTDFFFREIVPAPAFIYKDREGDYVLGGTGIEYVQWQADGGFILDESDFGVTVLWRSDAPRRTLRATGTQAGGAGFLVDMDL